MYIPTNSPRQNQPNDTTETPEQERQRRIRESLVYGKRELAGRPMTAAEQDAATLMRAKLQTQADQTHGKERTAREQQQRQLAKQSASHAAAKTSSAAEQRAHMENRQQQLAASRQQGLESDRNQGAQAARMQTRQGERGQQERVQAGRQAHGARAEQQADARQAAHAKEVQTARRNQDAASLQAQDRRAELAQHSQHAAQHARNAHDQSEAKNLQRSDARLLEQQMHKCLQQCMQRMLEEAGRSPVQGGSAYLDGIAKRLQGLEHAIRKDMQQQRLQSGAGGAQTTQALRDKLEFFQGFCQSLSEPASAKQKLMAQLDRLALVLERRAQMEQAASKDAQAARHAWKSYQDSLQELASSLAQSRSGLLRIELQRHQQRLAQAADEFKALSKSQLRHKCAEEQQVANSLQLLARLCSTHEEGGTLQLQIRKILDAERQRLHEIHEHRREAHKEVLARGEALLSRAEEEHKKKSLVALNVEKL